MKKLFTFFILFCSFSQCAGNLETAIMESDVDTVEQELNITVIDFEQKTRLIDLAQEVIENRKLKKMLYFIPHLIGAWWTLPFVIGGPLLIFKPFMDADPTTIGYKPELKSTSFREKLGKGLFFATIITGCGVAALRFVYNHYKKTDQLYNNAIAIKQLIYKAHSVKDLKIII